MADCGGRQRELLRGGAPALLRGVPAEEALIWRGLLFAAGCGRRAVEGGDCGSVRER
ncbi:hypothetical protein HMPREF0262_02962 [Clostridium sp. ATCC 29733]|nr:hypothetical protein HMPREF0262_02962 [Clostridium sp. ATCC 29733]